MTYRTVSYTHLDVYKRQFYDLSYKPSVFLVPCYHCPCLPSISNNQSDKCLIYFYLCVTTNVLQSKLVAATHSSTPAGGSLSQVLKTCYLFNLFIPKFQYIQFMSSVLSQRLHKLSFLKIYFVQLFLILCKISGCPCYNLQGTWIRQILVVSIENCIPSI